MHAQPTTALCQFTPTTPRLLITTALKRILESDEWKLGDREFKDLQGKELFEELEVVLARVIWLDFNKMPCIIQDVVGPTYPHLQLLYLGDNNIHSLHALPYLHAPALQKLYLNHNKISSLRPLRKTVFPRLKELNLNGNPIRCEQDLQLMPLREVEKLSLGYASSGSLLFESSWYAKGDFKNTTQISSAHSRLPSFSRSILFNSLRELQAKRRRQDKDKEKPMNLFKTFQN